MSVIDVTKSQTLPANISKTIATRIAIDEKLAEIKKKEDLLKKAKAKLEIMAETIDDQLIECHKEHGDFEVGEFKIKKSTTFKTKVLDESKLPGSCFKVETKKTVQLNVVKELILEGKIPRTVAFQEKNEKIKIK